MLDSSQIDFFKETIRLELDTMVQSKSYRRSEDLKRVVDAQSASEDNLGQILDDVPGFVSALSPEGEVEFVNREILEYFGKTFEEVSGWAINEKTEERLHNENLVLRRNRPHIDV